MGARSPIFSLRDTKRDWKQRHERFKWRRMCSPWLLSLSMQSRWDAVSKQRTRLLIYSGSIQLFALDMSIMFSPCGPLIREHGSREHCASRACRNEISPHCIVFQLASGGLALEAKLARTDVLSRLYLSPLVQTHEFLFG